MLADLLPMLRRDSRIAVQKAGSSGYWGFLRPNWLFPPFDNPAIRRALMGAIDQTEFMTAGTSAGPTGWHVPTGYFPPDAPMASDVGLATLTGPRDLGKVRRDLQAAGYGGEKIVLITPANALTVKAFSDVAADRLRKVGMNVDEQVMELRHLVQAPAQQEVAGRRRLERLIAERSKEPMCCRQPPIGF